MSDQRDGFLDVVRALATIRVVLWHAFGAAALTFLAAMPAMFFVTGSLYAKSVDRHGARTTLLDRLRRIAPSLWVFAALAWIAMLIGAWVSRTGLPLRNVAFWFVPLGEPSGSVWEGGWLATPLWYLRTLLWVFLLSSFVIGAVRRSPRCTLAAMAVGVVGLELVDRAGWFRPSFAEHVVWQAGDVVLYGAFFALGVLAHDGAFERVTRRHFVVVAAVGGVVAGAWWLTQPVPDGIVNNSHVVHLGVGAATLALALAARPALRRLATHRATSPVVRFLSRRSLTVYLWHTTAIVVALWFVNRAGPLPVGGWTVSYVAAVVGVTAVASVVFGWIEDLGGRRPPRLWPLSVARPATAWRWAPLGVAGLAVLLVAATSIPRTPSAEVAFRPRVPSQAPPRPEITEAAPLDVLETGPVAATPVVLDAMALQALIDEWRLELALPGASVAVATPDGDEFVTAVGARDDGRTRHLADQLDVMSITKLFTANLVYRAVDAGLLELDAPLPPLAAEPGFPYAGRVTVRQLLAHTTGIVNYRDSSRYATDPNSVASVSDAIASSAAEPLAAEPGVTPLYSSTNYLLLGRLLEQVSGVDYDELLSRELLAPLGLASAAHLPPDVGEPRYATAGLIADIGDLGRAGIALLRDHVGVSDGAFAEMSMIDPDSGMGPGLNGFCPCARDVDGDVQWFGVGYTGGNTLLAYIPGADVSVAIDVTGGLYSEGGHFDAVMELARRIATLVALQGEPAAPA